ncbi:stage II sporulation protein Q [Paenibacillus methanolicus]|uniref:Stage II sporulation protein Q n=2 Tax=Paenibacillus methanolicus TaxID=582686 RepID=A0A5S5CAN7_9BACL|nr:stage II sporulation protein Q [Paenibacillus methanolicus]
MNDQNKKPSQDAPKNVVGASNANTSAWRKLFSKKWTAPAAFMAAAAIIVTLMWVYQGPDETPTMSTTPDTEATTPGTTAEEATTQPAEEEEIIVKSGTETMQWPVADRNAVKVARSFYDINATKEERESALVQISADTIVGSTGISLAAEGDKSFDVAAALSGKVFLVDKHPTNGNIVEIKHADGLKTVYQSLSDVQVKVGDEVEQGAIIAKAGRNEIERQLGNHLFFAVYQNGTAVNPNTLLDQQAE